MFNNNSILYIFIKWNKIIFNYILIFSSLITKIELRKNKFQKSKRDKMTWEKVMLHGHYKLS